MGEKFSNVIRMWFPDSKTKTDADTKSPNYWALRGGGHLQTELQVGCPSRLKKNNSVELVHSGDPLVSEIKRPVRESKQKLMDTLAEGVVGVVGCDGGLTRRTTVDCSLFAAICKDCRNRSAAILWSPDLWRGVRETSDCELKNADSSIMNHNLPLKIRAWCMGTGRRTALPFPTGLFGFRGGDLWSGNGGVATGKFFP